MLHAVSTTASPAALVLLLKLRLLLPLLLLLSLLLLLKVLLLLSGRHNCVDAVSLAAEAAQTAGAARRAVGSASARRLCLKALRRGSVNSLALWFEFDLGKQTVSTQPLALRRLLLQQQQQPQANGASDAGVETAAASAADTPKTYYTQAWRQALVAFRPQEVREWAIGCLSCIVVIV